MNLNEDAAGDFNRRDFLKGTSLATLMAVMGGVPLRAEDAKPATVAPKKATNPPVNCAVIGCGLRGRDILNTLALMPNAPVVAVCDHYQAFLNRAKTAAPKAEGYTDYKQLLANKDVQAVLIATPTHLHREITVAALQAGKHVYLEAPLAHSLEDARAIAKAAQSALKSNFQSGLQMRSDPQRHFLLQFIRSGAAGKPISARAQWHKKESWRRTSPSPEREQELNWRLSNATSNGLIAEVGLHQIDVLGWFLKELPVAVTGFGGVRHWNDGRDVPDSIQATFEFPSGTLLNYDATLANSFDADYEMLYGTDSAVMIRANKAWMFKEVDSPLLGWEVYARKDEFYKETGIALVANATKIVAQGDKPVEDAPYANTSLSYALESFVSNTYVVASGVEDFASTFDVNNTAALKEYLASLAKSRLPAAGWQEGYEATVIAIKANEAILKRQRIAFEKEWFQV